MLEENELVGVKVLCGFVEPSFPKIIFPLE